jgi:chemotaxis-related protein WspB
VLFLVFRAAGARWALDASTVVEVVPLVRLAPLPHAPPYVRGLFRWRGLVLPAVDLSVLAGGEPAREMMSTRILVARMPDAGAGRFAGLVAEGVTGTALRPEGPASASGLSLPDAPWIAGVLPDGDEMVPCISPGRIVPPEVLEMVGEMAG